MPTGTVTLLFSDIEGSTVLLSRLGPAYAEVLSGQRAVLRAAWAAHGGTEMGTEGDSFFVAFPTAPAAVAAAVHAQHGLTARDWPTGASVKVRMGIHTGSPSVHDGGYVGMDVHRAARIAGAAHGGQVVVSAATAELVGAALPLDVRLRDLGSFRLKDLPAPERLFQLTGAGLLDHFPPLKTLGSASSLPRPATELVGRDGELAELTALLSSAGVRLMTLTGPGGSGKTRLAIAVAQQLVDRYPDGVFFVPLAAVTTPEVMRTTIAEVLDVPLEEWTAPSFFARLAHRRALFVLDNLEQLVGAGTVVADLLHEAPDVVVIATTRRPLHLAAEHEHAVPPLELAAEQADLAAAQRSGAVQLFVQQSQRIKSSFALSGGNLADVVALCRKLDGLPLAIELAAARTKLLTPRAILSRLDDALDLPGTSIDSPTRQHTLRAAIDWSYQLLTPEQQAFFRRVGVFAGGASIESIAAVTTDLDTGSDVFDTLSDLADASLITINEDADGEPRVALLETIRAYARDQLTTHGELDNTCRAHAQHYLKLTQQWSPLLLGDQHRAIRTRFQTEYDNLRDALAWALQPLAPTGGDQDRLRIGIDLCMEIQGFGFWFAAGPAAYSVEARVWLACAIGLAGDREWPQLPELHRAMARFLVQAREFDEARGHVTASIALLRRWDQTDRIPWLVCMLARIEEERGQPEAARSLFEEAATLGREVGSADPESGRQLMAVLGDFAMFEASMGNYERSLELGAEFLEISRQIGDTFMVLSFQQNTACTMRMMGRVAEADQLMRNLIPQALDFDDPQTMITLAEDYAAILAELHESRMAVRLLGAAEAQREKVGMPRHRSQQDAIAAPIARTRLELSSDEWEQTWQGGRSTSIENALAEAHASRAPTPDGLGLATWDGTGSRS
jgi:predicted ATPase/class 3 adenylate cyclase/tetratricopeptide (TPR) repeat protein